MDIRIYAEGSGFGESSDLDSVIDLLSGHNSAFGFCLKKSADTYRVRRINEYPVMKITRLSPGSIDIHLITEIAAALAPLAPQVFKHAWDLYKAGYDLISIATRHFNEKREPMPINIINSPGTVVNIINGTQVNTSPDVYQSAGAIHKFLDRIASLVKFEKADHVLLEAGEPADPEDVIHFDAGNKDAFSVSSVDILDQHLIEFECSIYRFNKKSMEGLLEYCDEDTGNYMFKPFTAKDCSLEDCMNAFRSTMVRVAATREFSVNALGEKSIKKFHLINILLG